MKCKKQFIKIFFIIVLIIFAYNSCSSKTLAKLSIINKRPSIESIEISGEYTKTINVMIKDVNGILSIKEAKIKIVFIENGVEKIFDKFGPDYVDLKQISKSDIQGNYEFKINMSNDDKEGAYRVKIKVSDDEYSVEDEKDFVFFHKSSFGGITGAFVFVGENAILKKYVNELINFIKGIFK